MDAATKKKLIIAGGIGAVALLLFANRNKAADGVYISPSIPNDVANGTGLTGNPPEFKYAGGGINMYNDGPRITWPAMNTLTPISVGGSSYKTGDMSLTNNFTGDFGVNSSNPLARDCCCDEAADPVQTVSSSIIVATSQPPKQWNGYGWQRPGYVPGVGDARGWSI